MRFDRTKSRLFFIVTLAAAALLVAPVLAQPGPMKAGRHGLHGPGMGLHRMLRHLDLSAEQREQLEQLHATHREETQAVRDRLHAAQERFSDLAHAETVDEEALREAAAEVAEARAEMMLSRAALGNRVRQILTPEQREQLDQMRMNRRGKMGGRGHGRGGHGPHHPDDCPWLDEEPDPGDE